MGTPPSAPSGGSPRGCGEQGVAMHAVIPVLGPSPRCGELLMTQHSSATPEGTSLRVQGAGLQLLERPDDPGAIPAGTGSSGCGTGACTMRGPSPRVRGPSPRVRGAGPRQEPAPRGPGTIPAGAGSRSCRSSLRGLRWDHPRGCGEQSFPNRKPVTCGGPSPRVRGADLEDGHVPQSDGTIPAGAGSRTTCSTARRATWDHPRGCGEQPPPPPSSCLPAGPSPRVRGAAARRSRVRGLPGTIPAGAGSSSEFAPMAVTRWDHPRGCGEQRPGA